VSSRGRASIWLTGSLLAIAACDPFATIQAADPALPDSVSISHERFRLSNGLEVVLHEDHTRPVIATRLTAFVGSAQDPPNKRGLAHLVEHLMFTPPTAADQTNYSQLLDEAGAWGTNGQTDRDSTSYFTTAPRAALPRILFAEAYRLTHHEEDVDDARVDHERTIVSSEGLIRFDAGRLGNLPGFVAAALYPPGHPYHVPPIGTRADLDGMSRADEKEFFGKYYGANHLLLVVAGDFVTKNVEDLIAREFSALPSGPPRESVPAQPSTLSFEQELDVDADVSRGQVVVTWPLPSRRDPNLLRLQTAAAYLGRTDHWPGLDNEDVTIGGGLVGSSISFTMVLGAGTTPSDALAHFDRTIAVIEDRRFAINLETFVRGRSASLANAIYSLDTLAARAVSLTNGVIYADDPDYVADGFELVRSMGPEDVRDEINRYLPLDRRVVTFVYVNPRAPRAGRLIRARPPLKDFQ